MKSRYQIVGEINQGGVGVVLKAWDTKLSRNVAIKRFLSAEQRAAMGNVEGDLIKEASTLSAMHHPNIVSVYDVDMEGEAGPEVIMEYLNGQDLEHAVAQAALTLEDFYQVAQQTLDALSNAHRMNLLHRDIKPANIQVTWLANGKFVSKFVDFGLAKFFEAPSKQTVRHDGTVMGSIYYMAPEQLERQALDNRSDLYSLGCVFYYALTMHRPFEGATVMDVINSHLHSRPVRIRDYRPNVPRDLELWVEWMINRHAVNRPSDADLVLTALRQIIAGQTPEMVPGVRVASQPVNESPMRTGHVGVPQSRAFASTTEQRGRSGTVPSTARRPAGSGHGNGNGKTKRKATAHGRRWVYAGGAAVVLAAGLAAAFNKRSKDQPDVNSLANSATPANLLDSATKTTELERTKAELAVAQARLAINQSSPANTAMSSDLSQPPGSGLILWLDASKSTYADADKTASLPNGPVGQWRDQSENGGRAVFQYTASVTKDREKSYPTLRTAPAGAGLLKATPVVTFDGAGDTLCVRDRDKVGDALAASLDGANLTVLVVYRDNGGPDAPEGLLTFKGEKSRTILTLGTLAQGLVAGPGGGSPLTISGTETEFRIASCVLDATGGGGIHLGLISSDGQKASSDFKVKAETKAHLEMIRMGTSDGTASGVRSMLGADIAEILIYNRALDRESRHMAENYLRQKYFGSTGPTVTANTKR
jgi:serine/threonine protein kinase